MFIKTEKVINLDRYSREALDRLNCGDGFEFRDWLSIYNPDLWATIGYINGLPVGWAATKVGDHQWDCEIGVYVDELFRGNNYGRILVDSCLKFIKEETRINTAGAIYI